MRRSLGNLPRTLAAILIVLGEACTRSAEESAEAPVDGVMYVSTAAP